MIEVTIHLAYDDELVTVMDELPPSEAFDGTEEPPQLSFTITTGAGYDRQEVTIIASAAMFYDLAQRILKQAGPYLQQPYKTAGEKP